MSAMLMECYRSIQDSSSKMLAAAQEENWDLVVQYEGLCAVLIAQLRACSRSEELQPEERREKGLIMRRILMNDAQIRDLAEPWMDHSSASSSCAEQRVLH
jgi:flagellar protein FliT